MVKELSDKDKQWLFTDHRTKSQKIIDYIKNKLNIGERCAFCHKKVDKGILFNFGNIHGICCNERCFKNLNKK